VQNFDFLSHLIVLKNGRWLHHRPLDIRSPIRIA